MIEPLDEVAGAVDVAADEMSAQPSAQAQRPFQVDRAARAEFAQVGPRQRLRTGLKRHRAAVDGHDRQAAAVDRDAVGHGGLRGDLLVTDDQTAAGRLRADFRHACPGLRRFRKTCDDLSHSARVKLSLAGPVPFFTTL